MHKFMNTCAFLSIRWKLWLVLVAGFLAWPLAAAEVVLVPGGFGVSGGTTNWRYRLGSNEVSAPITAWRSNSFVENASWGNAALPLGYPSGGSTEPYEIALVTTVPASSTANYLSVFLRKTFVVTNRASYSAVTLGVRVDDGVVAWLNGQEIMRFQCCQVSDFAGADTTTPGYNAGATSAAESVPNTNVLVNNLTGPLVDGTNILTIQLFNANLDSSDLVIDAELRATLDETPPIIVARSPAPGTVSELAAIQVNFSEDVAGVDAADLLINNQPATNVLAISPSIYTWEFSQPPTGTVNVAFADGHGITDVSAQSNAFAGSTWSYTLNTNIMLPQFFITEFMANNSGDGVNGIRDEDGDSSDWIEIYNSQGTPGNIGGWFLTDTTNNLTKWRFPNGATVPANGYLIVWASGKNRTNNLARPHANFQLNTTGEYLGLLNPMTNVISEFYPTYPTQRVDVSYGRDRVNPSIVGFYTTPTPGSNNVTSGSGFAPEVQFSRAGGSFAGSFQLALSVEDTNSEIRYTLVNSAQSFATATNIPTQASTLYTGPITVNDTVQVRARAFKTNGNFFPGPVRTECYLALGSGASNFVSTLPIIVLHTIGTTSMSGGYPTPDNSIIFACFDNDSGTATLNGPPQMIKRAGVNLRGSSTQGFPKPSFAVELWDEFNEDEEESVAGLPKESDWVLYSPNQFDLSMMHNPIMHQVARDMGYYSSRTRFVEVFFRNGTGPLTANTNQTGANMGDYYGIFVLEEKVKRDGNRVDIDELQVQNTNAPSVTGGYLLKVDRTDANERTFSGGSMTINYQDPDGLEMVTPVRAAQANYIKSYLDTMYAGLQGTALTNIAGPNHYSNFIDLDDTLDLHIVNVLVMNADGYRLSGYMYKPRNGKLVMGPLWDVDRGLGTSRGDQRTFHPRAWQSHDASSCGGTDYGTDFFGGSLVNTWVWLNRLFTDVDFWQMWVDRYQQWRLTVLDTNNIGAMVDEFAAQIIPAQPRESRRWGGNGASNTDPRNGTVQNCTGQYSHNFPGTYQGEVDFQKRWLFDHINFMDTNLLNRPALSARGGQVPLGTLVTLTDTSGKTNTAIYYTLDGSDPRGFQGTTNPAAILYSGPITIADNVRIRARAVNANHRNLTGTLPSGSRNPIVSTPWSGDVAETYYLTIPPLVISELMYHPAPPASVNDTNDADNFEYVELMNVGSNTLNLAGFRFTNGIEFTFTASNAVTVLGPGERVLIVKHLAAFTSRYGAPSNVAGVYDGNLDNAGERLTLVGPRLEPILDFVYSDDWYPVSDGFGFSLVIVDPYAPLDTWGTRANWRVSSLEFGSPGAEDPPPPVLPLVLVNEALTHTDPPAVDTIELYNPGAQDADISGWFLTDDGTDPKKYQFPPGTTVPAGGFLLIDEDQFNVPPNGFALGSDGDEVYLFSGTNGLLTGYAHGFSFGAAQNGVTFGRYVTSQNEEHFVAQAANSLGASNSLPLVGPIVISEILYHPVDTYAGTNRIDNSLDEFVELYNLTATNVPLFHSVYTSNTWRLTSAVDFTFPEGQSLGSSNFALVVNFDPIASPGQLAAFRSKYGVPPGVAIYGPYSGKLDNGGESVRLRRPDTPNLDGDVPYILVDKIDYSDHTPWPELAGGTGASIQRLVTPDYGNDPTNWAAAKPSANGLYVGGTLPVVTQQPTDTNAFPSETAYFTVAVSGSGVCVQWRFNGVAIPGATNLTLAVTNVQFPSAGLYDAVVFNPAGVTMSSSAFLTVLVPLTISTHPADQAVLPGTNVTLSVSAFGSGVLRYQWQYERTNVPNATNATYSFTDASLDYGHGTWRVIVSDDYRTLTSSNAFIFVLVRPVFVVNPQPQTILAGQNATFTAIATGAPPIWYRWLRQGVPLVTNDTGVLTLSNVTASATIRVLATNRATTASGVAMTPAGGVQLTVLADNDRDGMADAWETNYFGAGASTNASNATEDPDGDGMINRDEYVAGTNPTNALSVLKLFTVDTNVAVLRFVAQSNISYAVECRTNLTDAAWTNITNISGQPGVRTVEVNAVLAPGSSEQYYRVRTPQ